MATVRVFSKQNRMGKASEQRKINSLSRGAFEFVKYMGKKNPNQTLQNPKPS